MRVRRLFGNMSCRVISCSKLSLQLTNSFVSACEMCECLSDQRESKKYVPVNVDAAAKDPIRITYDFDSNGVALL